MPDDYLQSVIELQDSAPACLHSTQSPVFSLPDASTRVTWARESGHVSQFPDCVRSPASVIHKYYNELDTLVSNVIVKLSSDDSEDSTRWKSSENVDGNFASVNYKVG